jgi:hypothetical protein
MIQMLFVVRSSSDDKYSRKNLKMPDLFSKTNSGILACKPPIFKKIGA